MHVSHLQMVLQQKGTWAEFHDVPSDFLYVSDHLDVLLPCYEALQLLKGSAFILNLCLWLQVSAWRLRDTRWYHTERLAGSHSLTRQKKHMFFINPQLFWVLY